MNRLIGEPTPAKRIHVGGTDGGRLAGEASGEVAERARARVELSPAAVGSRGLR